VNLTLSSLDSVKGLDSEIIKLKSNYKNPLLKVVFPLPNGNGSVVMKNEVLEDGSLLLSRW